MYYFTGTIGIQIGLLTSKSAEEDLPMFLPGPARVDLEHKSRLGAPESIARVGAAEALPEIRAKKYPVGQEEVDSTSEAVVEPDVSGSHGNAAVLEFRGEGAGAAGCPVGFPFLGPTEKEVKQRSGDEVRLKLSKESSFLAQLGEFILSAEKEVERGDLDLAGPQPIGDRGSHSGGSSGVAEHELGHELLPEEGVGSENREVEGAVKVETVIGAEGPGGSAQGVRELRAQGSGMGHRRLRSKQSDEDERYDEPEGHRTPFFRAAVRWAP